MRPILAALLAVSMCGTAPAAAVPLHVLWKTGDAAPGAPEGARFATFERRPALNNNGELAFSGTLEIGRGGVTAETAAGVWAPDGFGGVRLLARSGDFAPDAGAGRHFVYLLGAPQLNDSGLTVFAAQVERLPNVHYNYFGNGPGGLWFADRGSAPVLRVGLELPVPGVPGNVRFLGNFPQLALDARGSVAFTGNLDGVGTWGDDGVWGPGPDGSLTLLGREDDPALGAPAGSRFDPFFRGLTMNFVGAVAFRGGLRIGYGGTQIPDSSGFWATDPEGLVSLRTRAGRPAPGDPLGPPLQIMFNAWPAIDARGRIAFSAVVTDETTGTSSTILFGPDASGETGPLARSGDPAPGTLDGARFDYFPDSIHNIRSPVMNLAGETLFSATLQHVDGVVDANNDAGLWIHDHKGQLRLIVREGDPVPGRPDLRFRYIGDFFLSERGNVVFLATLAPMVGEWTYWPVPKTALFVADDPGHVVKIVQEGDVIEVAPGDSRTLGDLWSVQANGANELAAFSHDANSLNTSGDFAFRVKFRDGAQALLLARIPEPGSAVLLGVGLCGLAVGGRRRPRSRALRVDWSYEGPIAPSRI